MSDGGSIILNASVVASKGLPANSVYSATSRVLVRSHLDHGLKGAAHSRECSDPGATDTPGLSDLLALPQKILFHDLVDE